MKNAFILFCLIMSGLSLCGVMTSGHTLWHICFLGYSTVGALTILLTPERS